MLSSPHQRPGDEIEFSALQPLQSVGQPPASDAARERGRQWAISKVGELRAAQGAELSQPMSARPGMGPFG